MKKKESILKKINMVLNTSSETFMLIALIGLFAMPIIISKSLEPIVQEANTKNYTVAPIAQNNESLSFNPKEINNNVLGAETSAIPVDVVVNEESLKLFDNGNQSLSSTSYTLQVSSAQAYEKRALFTLKNSSTLTQTYQFTVMRNSEASNGEILFVGDKEYKVGTSELPEFITLNPLNEMVFSVSNTTGSPTDSTIQITQFNN